LHTHAHISNSSRSFLAIVEWLLLAGLMIAFVTLGFLPAWRTMNTDFPNYYLAASIHHQGIPLDRAYEWRWFQRHKDHLEIQQTIVGFVPNPPLCAVPMLPLALLPALEAKRVWLVLNLGFLALALCTLRRTTQLSWRRLLLFTFLCILPLRENFLFGQYYVVILLLICAAYYAACRGHRFTSGALLAAAASLKIFPAFFLILFLRKRNWRAAVGLVAGGIVLAAVSVLIFGWDVHRILLVEILPRAMHGDLVGPYTLRWDSFTALWHYFFLFEPQLNSTPLLNSPMVYAVVQAFVASALIVSFLLAVGEDDGPQSRAWEWATFATLLFLLSSMPSSYHFCVLIFTAIVALQMLLEANRPSVTIAFVLLFALACYPFPGLIWLQLQGRLVVVLLLYVLLLLQAPNRAGKRAQWWVLAVLLFVGLAASNFRSLRNRAEDFSQRLPESTGGYATFAAAASPAGVILDEMLLSSTLQAFRAVAVAGSQVLPVPASGDVLSFAASSESPFIYFELTNRRSQIFRMPVDRIGRPNMVPEYVAEGEEPAISQDGRWLAFLHDEGRGQSTIWLSKDRAPSSPARGAQNLADVLEMSVTPSGDIVAARGGPANPRLVLLHTASGEVQPLTDIAGAVRYPAVSPNGKWLAFSRRESGSWHLFVRDLAHKTEQQLTHAACNAVSPTWQDSQTLLYVSDCGRGFGLGALVRVPVTW
jgi:Glycosyltransferase family 87/WD40-like Beta Propeller Repeat